MDLSAADGNYPGGTLIVGKDLNPPVLEVLNKRKQDIINSFEFAKSRTLTQIVDSEHTAGHSAVQGGGKASESCVARVGKYKSGCIKGGANGVTVKRFNVTKPKLQFL